MNRDATVFVDYDGYVAMETDKAILFRSDGGEEVWVPRSVLGRITYTDIGGDQEEVFVGEYVEAFEVKLWFAKKNSLA